MIDEIQNQNKISNNDNKNKINDNIESTKKSNNVSKTVRKKKNKNSNLKRKKINTNTQIIRHNKNIFRAITSLNNDSNIVLDTKSKKLKIEKINEIMKYNDDEMNKLTYDLAYKSDNRTYCQYYISLLKIKHNLIFSFFTKNDYNSRIIKIDLFFYQFYYLF